LVGAALVAGCALLAIVAALAFVWVLDDPQAPVAIQILAWCVGIACLAGMLHLARRIIVGDERP
jgi:hypothetical protein